MSSMECRYCQASNAEDDHRCRRCGRRLRLTPVYTTSAAVPALRPEFIESESADSSRTCCNRASTTAAPRHHVSTVAV